MGEVKIPISADVQPVLESLRKLQAALRGTAHENKKLRTEATQSAASFEMLKKSSQTLRNSLTATGQLSKPFQDINFSKIKNDTVMKMASRVLPEGGGGITSSVLGGFAGSKLASIGKLAGGPLAIAGLTAGYSVNRMLKDVPTARQENVQLTDFYRQTNELGTDFSAFKAEIRKAGASFGLMSNESIGLSKAFAKTAGLTDISAISKGTDTAVKLSRSLGIDPAQGVAGVGNLRWMMDGQMKSEKLARLIAEAVAAGNMKSRPDAVIASLNRFVSTAEQVLVNPPNLSAFADLKAQLDSSGMPGLRGAAGDNVLARFDAGIRNPGGGLAGDFHLYRAIGKGLGPYQVDYLKETGLFGSRKSAGLGDDDETNFSKTKRYFAERFPNDPYRRWGNIKGTLRISQHQAEGLEKAAKDKADIDELLRKSAIRKGSANLGAMGLFSKIAGADSDELSKVKKEFIAKYGSKMNRGDLVTLTNATNPKRLRPTLTQMANRYGAERLIGDEMRQSEANRQRAAIPGAEVLEAPLRKINDGVSAMVEMFGDITVKLDKAIDSFERSNDHQYPGAH